MFPINSIKFEIPGNVQGWQRRIVDPRSGRSFVPEKTASYKDFVKWCFRNRCRQCPEEWISTTKRPIKAIITVYFVPAKEITSTKWKNEAFKAGQIAVTKKPDCDNIAKGILDALNHLAYHDDAQVFELSVQKLYGETAKVEVELIEFLQPSSAKEWKNNWLTNSDVSGTIKEP